MGEISKDTQALIDAVDYYVKTWGGNRKYFTINPSKENILAMVESGDLMAVVLEGLCEVLEEIG